MIILGSVALFGWMLPKTLGMALVALPLLVISCPVLASERVHLEGLPHQRRHAHGVMSYAVDLHPRGSN